MSKLVYTANGLFTQNNVVLIDYTQQELTLNCPVIDNNNNNNNNNNINTENTNTNNSTNNSTNNT